MITSRTITARSPVAACRSSAFMLSQREPTMRTAINHVIKLATKAMPAPRATGRRWLRLAPTILAVMAAYGTLATAGRREWTRGQTAPGSHSFTDLDERMFTFKHEYFA